MRKVETQIVLRIKNNTSFSQSIEILKAIPNINSASNSDRMYSWNLTTENYSGSYLVTIYISNTSNTTPVYYSVSLSSNNIQSVVSALNSLNQGLFQYSGDTIYVSSSYYIYGALEVVSTAFISTWNTSNTTVGSSAANQVQLPLDSSGTYNFVVNWGDGTQNTITVWNQAQTLHTYAVAGTYTITITGTITGFVFNFTGDRNKILSISNWGTLKLGNTGNYFAFCQNLNLSSVVGVLNLTGTTILTSMFNSCNSLTTINNINQWNVSNVTFMDDLFSNSNFNDNLSNWNVSSVINMNSMFQSTPFNYNINSWNVSNVQTFASMFSNATNFNQPLNSWNLISALSIFGMFATATSFNQPLNSWNVSNVTDFGSVFNFNTAFNQPLNSWNVSSATNMGFMFRGASIFNQPLNSWNVINVIDMTSMFNSATAFNQNIGSWNISNVSSFLNFMLNKTNLNYSTTNLNAIYNGWSLLPVQPNLTNVNFGSIKYTIAGQAGKNILTGAPNNWIIVDGGI